MAKGKVFWTDEEWDQLADLVDVMRKNDPASALTTLCNRAVAQFPKDRQRSLQTHTIGPVIERLKAKSAPTQQISEGELLRLAPKVLALLSPVERLEGLSPEVILDCVGFKHVTAYAVSQLIERMDVSREKEYVPSLPAQAAPSGPITKPARVDLKRIAIFGMLAGQQHILENAFKGRVQFKFIDKNQKTDVPLGMDGYVIWSKFCSHSLDKAITIANNGGKIIRHFGGIKEMVAKIETLL